MLCASISMTLWKRQNDTPENSWVVSGDEGGGRGCLQRDGVTGLGDGTVPCGSAVVQAGLHTARPRARLTEDDSNHSNQAGTGRPRPVQAMAEGHSLAGRRGERASRIAAEQALTGHWRWTHRAAPRRRTRAGRQFGKRTGYTRVTPVSFLP